MLLGLDDSGCAVDIVIGANKVGMEQQECYGGIKQGRWLSGAVAGVVVDGNVHFR